MDAPDALRAPGNLAAPFRNDVAVELQTTSRVFSAILVSDLIGIVKFVGAVSGCRSHTGTPMRITI